MAVVLVKNKILAIPGSLRKESSNVKILQAVKQLYALQADMEIYDGMGALPFFDPSLPEDAGPQQVVELKKYVAEADAILICTPEYVFSLPGVLKNLFEWLVSDTVLSGKRVAYIVAATDGRKTFESLDLVLATLVQQPVPEERKLLLRGARGIINADGAFTNEEIKQQVCGVIDALLDTNSYL
ncbi:MAG: NAD(P)H-dependent oxidoreductase [Chitinophagaceae bacterium]|nr:MAG: NAD(P)H-dependent oxidoreductase [Chitinophagaceae bacterium]